MSQGRRYDGRRAKATAIAVLSLFPLIRSASYSKQKEFASNRSSKRFPKVVASGILGGGTLVAHQRTASHKLESPKRIGSRITNLAAAYAASLKIRPILTKSITSCFMFGLSDWMAQSLSSSSTAATIDWSRTYTFMLVGLLYFGPCAHWWYNLMFRLFPSPVIWSTLTKTALGQLVFGPIFMCVFVFASLLQQQGIHISMENYVTKVGNDLPRAFVTGLGYWPVMSYISYTHVPKDWLPLFSNCCTLIFNIFLSLVTYRSQQD